MPNFKIISPQGQPFTVITNATTWGQLKSELSNRINGLDNMLAVVKSNKNNMEHPEAALPNHDDTIFLSSKAIKAGQIDIVAVLNRLREKFNDAFDDVIEAVEDGDMGDPEEIGYDMGETEDPDMAEYRRIQRQMNG